MEAYFFYSGPLSFIVQVLCFDKFAYSFYKVTESQMALTKALIYINVMKFCKDDIKIQNTEQTENQIKHRKSSFAKE